MRWLLVIVAAGCGDNVHPPDAAMPAPVFAQTAYIKSSQPLHDAHFGTSALSGAGDTLVAAQVGVVTVYERDSTWRVVGELAPSGPAISFGSSVAISSDGSTIAVAAIDDHRAYVYRKVDTAWTFDARIDGTEEFGRTLALSSDGNLLVVGSRNPSSDIGRVRTYERDASGWLQVATIGGGPDDFHFGQTLALAPDGTMLAASVYRTGARDSTVEVYGRSGQMWLRHATLASPSPTYEDFAVSISCSTRCETIAIGADQPPAPVSVPGMVGAGVAYLFEGDGAVWTPTTTLTASNAEIGDAFGTAVAVSGDGSTIVVGASSESSNATGINGDELDNSAPYAGAAYVYRRWGAGWPQVMYLKASNAETVDIFGKLVGLANDGTTIVVTALYENGGSSGVNGDQSDNSQPYAGAIYAFEGTFD